MTLIDVNEGHLLRPELKAVDMSAARVTDLDSGTLQNQLCQLPGSLV